MKYLNAVVLSVYFMCSNFFFWILSDNIILA